jgi:hypothetical protein
MAKTKRKQRAAALLAKVRKHLQADPARLPVLEQVFQAYERPNLHLAIEEILGGLAKQVFIVGVVPQHDYETVRLAKFSRQSTAREYFEGPVEYVDVPLADGRQLACIRRGLFLLALANQPIVMLVTQERYYGEGIVVEVMARDREQAEQFLRRLTRETRHGRAFRGNILSIDEDCHGNVSVQFHRLPAVRKNDIILPKEVFERMERHTIGLTRHAEQLRAAGRHLKRGLLLHGFPGTGKTLSAMYLASQMPGRTVLLMTGASIQALDAACRLARMLTPATIILEDVDLIGTERQHQTVDANALLFELLNQMDGLAEDADLLFVLTTNRPDILEPALAARPGRIDQALEIPLPDADCRQRLFELYGGGLKTEGIDWNRLVERTEGASGAFIRELLRKAALFAAEDSAAGDLVVRQEHLEEGLAELLVAGGKLTQSLLGVGRQVGPSGA